MASGVNRLTGMYSGLDTESLVTALTSSYKTKVDNAKKAQTKLEWKQDAWKDMNSKIYKLYSGTLSTMRFSSAYSKKKTVSSSNALSVTASDNAANGIQTAQIVSMAKAGSLTGNEITDANNNKVTQDTKVTELGIAAGTKISLSVGSETKEIEVTEDMTMYGLTTAMKEAGVNANFDVGNERLFISAKSTGAENDFQFSADDDVLNKLGIGADAVRIQGSDAELKLNGASFKSSTNTFKINGSTYEINSMTDEEISISTQDDTSGVYDMIKNFFKQYNETINAMSTAYNAESTTYEPLLDEEKDVLSESEVDKWEQKVKDSLLRKDSSLYNVMSTMRSVMMSSIEIDGETYSLADFGIATGDYFTTDENERYAYHINGDSDDEVSSTKSDKLKSMIAENPELVEKFFSQLSQKLYTSVDEKMRSTDYSSAYKVYDDKKMKSDYSDYTKKISDLEKKLQEAEDRYYDKFSKMETMLASLQSKTDSISQLFQ